MRFDHIRIKLTGLFLVLHRKSCGSAYLRLYALLILAVCFILIYIATTPEKSLELPANELRGKQCAYGQRISDGDRENWNKSEDVQDPSQQSALTLNQTSRRTFGVVPVKCDARIHVSEILRMRPIKYLSNFKNPCWHEPLETSIEEFYVNNGFAKYSYTYEKALNKFIDNYLNKDINASHRLRCLPYFFLAGQPKCGSTDFYNRIVRHPDVAIPPVKENHWWGKNRYGWCLNYTETISFKDYVDLFDGAAMRIKQVVDKTHSGRHGYHQLITGDASVSTLWCNDDWWKNSENCGLQEPRFTNAHHVHFVLPQARIIVILRNPTDRLYSDFLYFQHSSKSQHCFHREVTTAINALNECTRNLGIRACVYNVTIASTSRARLRLGLYHVYLQEWLTLFPRNQVLVVRLEDYAERPLDIIKEVHQFLNLRTLSEDEHEELMDRPMLNTRRESDRKLGLMLPETKALLDNFYRPYNVKLAKLLGDNRFLWRDV